MEAANSPIFSLINRFYLVGLNIISRAPRLHFQRRHKTEKQKPHCQVTLTTFTKKQSATSVLILMVRHYQVLHFSGDPRTHYMTTADRMLIIVLFFGHNNFWKQRHKSISIAPL